MPEKLRRWAQLWYALEVVVFVAFMVIAAITIVAALNQGTVSFVSLSFSLFVVYLTTLRSFIRRPRLMLFADDDDTQWSPPFQSDNLGSWFVRLRIGNCGRTVAKNCVGRLVDVWTVNGEQLKKFDPLTLYWARQDKEHTGFSPIDIQSGGDFDFLDIAQVKLDKVPPISLRVVIPPPMTLVKYPAEYPSPGIEPDLVENTYYFRIGIYADDAYVSLSWFELTYLGAGNIPQIKRKKPRFAYWHGR